MPDKTPKWTPGEWSAWDRGIGWEVHVPDPKFGTRPINEGFRDTFSKPDALLIAAAPDLYAALETIVRDADHGFECSVNTLGDGCSCMVGSARAALSKARLGETGRENQQARKGRSK